MLTTFKSIDAWLLAPFLRYADALCDPRRRDRAMLLSVLAYIVIWFLYAIVAKSSQGINADLGEMVVWSRNLDWGYPKHPPLTGWMLAVWFAIFPLADWAFYLLAAINLGIGIYLTYVACSLWLDDEKLAVAPFLLALIPFYNFLGLKWDQNSVLIPLWALATWAFVLSLRTRYWPYAALASAAAVAAVLVKYWSVFLVCALAVAALVDRRRAAYFRSPAPWVAAGVGVVLLAPHVAWLIRESFPPLQWVSTRRITEGVYSWISSTTEYSLGTLGYSIVTLATYAVLVRPSPPAIRDSMMPSDNERRTAAVIFWIPLLLPLLIAILSKVNLLSVWNTGSLALLPVVLLSSPLVSVSRVVAARIIGFSTIVSVVALLVSPLVAASKVSGIENNANYVSEAVKAIEGEWRATTDRPLEILGGPFGLVSSSAFTLKDRPSTYADFSSYMSPWADTAALTRKGMAIICPARDEFCLRFLDALAKIRPLARRTEVELTPRWLWLTGEPARFVIATMPPR